MFCQKRGLSKEVYWEGIIEKVLKVVDRYESGHSAPHLFPRNPTEEKITIYAQKVIGALENWSLLRMWFNSIHNKNLPSIKTATFGDYYVNITSYKKPKYILLTDEDELHAFNDVSKNKLLFSLPNDIY